MTNNEAIEMIRNDMKLHHDYLSGEYRQALGMAVKALEAEQWIPCSEKLPTKPGRYFVTQKRPYGMCMTTAYFDREFWDEAVAWMPLPEPYKENKDASI